MAPLVVGGGAAEGGEGGGELEGEYVAETDAAAAAGKMQRSRAAIGEKRELGRVDALARR
jgi:hypothetical protein